MKLLIFLSISIISLTLVFCSEESPNTPPNQSTTGKLVITSIPSGARIFLQGTDTGKNTPDTIKNLEPGVYTGYLSLEYYQIAYFTTSISANLTTTENIPLNDIGIEFQWDYEIRSGGDSVQFKYSINQDVRLDSIVVDRPVNDTSRVTDKYAYNQKLFLAKDTSGTQIIYLLPPEEDGRTYYPRIDDEFYKIYVYGRKVHGSQSYFSNFYEQEL
jgi:hypothetical protein